MTIKNEKRKAEQGFTLIELSIVLVIIGLIVGGVLVGQDLIKAAEIRATISQYEKYNTAVNTFRGKYNGIPGDLSGTTASQFGLSITSTGAPCASLGATGCGDGNGLIEGGASGSTALQAENVNFFRQLGDVGMVDGSFAQVGAASGTLATTGALGAATSGSGIPLLFPAAKLGRGNYWTPASFSGINYYVLSGLAGATISTAGAITAGSTNNLTPAEAQNIDKKVDDGSATTGSIVAINAIFATNPITTSIDIGTNGSGAATATAAAAGSTGCEITGTLTSYNVTATAQSCSLRLRFN